jgi:hypothetical protein
MQDNQKQHNHTDQQQDQNNNPTHKRKVFSKKTN